MKRFGDERERGVEGSWDSCYALERDVVWEVWDQRLWWWRIGGFFTHWWPDFMCVCVYRRD